MADLGNFAQHAGGIALDQPIRIAARNLDHVADDAQRPRRRSQVAGDLQGHPGLQRCQHVLGQRQDAGAVGTLGVEGDPDDRRDHQHDTDHRDADPQQRPAPATALLQRIDVDVDDLGGDRHA